MKTMTRQEAIDRLRGRLMEMVDEDHSICEVAAEQGVYCHGFSQWSFDELKERYYWLADRRPNITREELERLANIWQVARSQVLGTPMACDTQALEHDTCKGWDEWDNETLARYIHELCGQQVSVVGDEARA
jgi:uncharacterized protein YciW